VGVERTSWGWKRYLAVPVFKKGEKNEFI